MRVSRVTIAGTVMLALLGGLGGAAVGQDDEEQETPVTATHVTGTRLSQAFDDSGVEVTVDELGLEHDRGWRIDEKWSWSDPRLPEARTGVWDVVMHGMDEDGMVAVWLGAVRLDGPAGSWTGTQTVLYDVVERGGIGQDVYVGEGDYACLLYTSDAADDLA